MAEMAGKKARTVRLMITKMILENFKSYAGVQEIGPFHKRFSSIVGPNGSGKSNVIDALLFVFGKRAKQLRLNKVSELIHKSSGFPNLESCCVEVHFQLIEDFDDHPDDFEVVPGSEFVVTRTAYNNNQSKYTVDSKTSTYSEVGLLLRGHGIDLDNNRFLILQGEVEQIAMMKPKAAAPGEEGLLEYLEDIIGSNRFVERIEEMSKVLDGLNEQRTEKVNRLKIAERERDNLSGSKGEAEAFMEKDREIRRRKNTLFQLYEHTAKESVQQQGEKKAQLAEKLAYEQSKKSESDEQLAAMEKQYAQTVADHNSVCAELNLATEENSAFERRAVKLKEDLKYQRAQLKKLQEQIKKDAKKEEESLKDADAALATVEKTRGTVDEQRARKAEEEKVIDDIMSSMQDATAELRSQLETVNANLIAAERGVASLQTEKETVTTKLQLAQSRSDNAAKAVKSSEEKISKLKADRVTAEARISAAGKEQNDVKQQIAQFEALMGECDGEEARVHKELIAATANAEEAKASLSQARGNSASTIIDNILKATKKGGPLAAAGVRGRLGDLGTIAAEFDVAISTACGMLDNVVVDTVEGAQACVEFLKRTNAGRMTFIASDQLEAQRRKIDVPFAAPEGSQRLFDLVKPLDPAFRPALYRALGDCLVANDLATATRIALQGPVRFRVVTKDGKLVESNGAMTGGGTQHKSGLMTITGSAKSKSALAKNEAAEEFTPQQAALLEKKVGELKAELAEIRAAKADAEKSIKEGYARIKALATEVERLQLQLARWVEQESELRERIDSLRRELTLSADEAAEVAAAQERLAALDQEITTKSPNLSKLTAEQKSLQRKIQDVGGPKLAKAQQKLDILTSQIEQLSSVLSTKVVEESSQRKAAAKAAAARSKGEADATKVEEKLTKLQSEESEMEADAEKVLAAVEQSQARMAAAEELLKKITQQHEAVKKDVQKIRAVEVDLKEAMDEANRKMKEGHDQTAHWAKEIRVLQKAHLEDQREFNATVRSILQDKKAVAAASGAEEGAAGNAEAESEVETLPTLSPERLAAIASDVDELKHEIHILEAERERLKAHVNMGALLEYMKKDAFYRSRLAELEVITEQRNNTRRDYEDLRRQRLEEFMSGFGTITLKLKEMYQMITLGGDAELELVDSLDPFSEGIVFSVRPPKKSWKNISNLSGGEKTLSSLALVFALHHYKPTPLYVMDEIDAALVCHPLSSTIFSP